VPSLDRVNPVNDESLFAALPESFAAPTLSSFRPGIGFTARLSLIAWWRHDHHRP
jgi:hypothetical protein